MATPSPLNNPDEVPKRGGQRIPLPSPGPGHWKTTPPAPQRESAIAPSARPSAGFDAGLPLVALGRDSTEQCAPDSADARYAQSGATGVCAWERSLSQSASASSVRARARLTALGHPAHAAPPENMSRSSGSRAPGGTAGSCAGSRLGTGAAGCLSAAEARCGLSSCFQRSSNEQAGVSTRESEMHLI